MSRRVWIIVVTGTIVSVVAMQAALRLMGLGNPPIAMRDTDLEYRLICPSSGILGQMAA